MIAALVAVIELGPPSLVSEAKPVPLTSSHPRTNYSVIFLSILHLINLQPLPRHVYKFPPGYMALDHRRWHCA